MREIKFRFWMILERKIVNNLKVNSHHSINSQFNGDAFVAIPMQYTGLKDKNGVEIYEGDIVKYTRGTTSYLAEVKFGRYLDEEQYSTWDHLGYYIYNAGETHSLMDLEGDLTVIGNIYENPELQKMESNNE